MAALAGKLELILRRHASKVELTTALLGTYGFEVRTQHQLSSCRHLAGARDTPIQATGAAGAHCSRLH